jgi:hypothetical protein
LQADVNGRFSLRYGILLEYRDGKGIKSCGGTFGEH